VLVLSVRTWTRVGPADCEQRDVECGTIKNQSQKASAVPTRLLLPSPRRLFISLQREIILGHTHTHTHTDLQ